MKPRRWPEPPRTLSWWSIAEGRGASWIGLDHRNAVIAAPTRYARVRVRKPGACYGREGGNDRAAGAYGVRDPVL